MESLDEIRTTTMEAFVKEIKRRNRYFNDNSSLRGVGHVISLVRTPVVKRSFWFVTTLACTIGTASVLSGVLKLYTEDIVSYSVETDYLAWDTPFPAVTLCEQLNENRLKTEFNKKNIPSALIPFGKDVSFWNNKYCKTCPNCELDVSCIQDFMPLVAIARSACEEMMTQCWFDEKYFSCCERFKPMSTEFGICFAFNSELTGDGNIVVNRKFRLPTLKFSVLSNVIIRVHSPEEVLSVASENILGTGFSLPRGSYFDLNLQAEEIKSDRAVRTVPPSSRDCLFKDETPDLAKWPFSTYSYGACLWYCRSLEHIRLCNCTYHFMPKIDQVPVCNVQGLRCLNEFKDNMDYNMASCKCPMTCNEINYKVVYSYSQRQEATKGQESRVTQGSVKIGQFPTLRVRRRVIRDMLGLVVDIGGVAGVFFGASILSFIEIIYIFCIRKYR